MLQAFIKLKRTLVVKCTFCSWLYNLASMQFKIPTGVLNIKIKTFKTEIYKNNANKCP